MDITRDFITCYSCSYYSLLVQVVDVLIKKPFKDEVGSLFEDYLDKNLDQYVDGKINASQRRVLMTKWVVEAWSKAGKMKDSVIGSFKKCGL